MPSANLFKLSKNNTNFDFFNFWLCCFCIGTITIHLINSILQFEVQRQMHINTWNWVWSAFTKWKSRILPLLIIGRLWKKARFSAYKRSIFCLVWIVFSWGWGYILHSLSARVCMSACMCVCVYVCVCMHECLHVFVCVWKHK